MRHSPPSVFLVPWGTYLQTASIPDRLILSFGTLREQIAQPYLDKTYRYQQQIIILLVLQVMNRSLSENFTNHPSIFLSQ
ncbi:hypothetical protein ACWATR_34300 [Nostoc sp. UIC 10890]